MVSRRSADSGASDLGSIPGQGHRVVLWARHFALTCITYVLSKT